jgi:hypothetical protein
MQRSVDRRDFEAAVDLRKGFESTPRADGIVVPDGDCWVCEGYEMQGAWITASFDADDLERWRSFQPLKEEPDLFLRFSRIWQEKNFPGAAVAFAHRFGLPRATGTESRPFQPTRLSLREFFEESQRAWVALSLYETVLNKDGASARALLEEHRHLDAGLENCYKHMQPTSADVVPLTPLQGAVAGYARIIYGMVRELSSQSVSVTFDRPDLDPTSVKVTWSFDNLLGALYLQMWWVVTSSGELSRCEQCGRLISLSRPDPGGRKRRSDKRFCDDACRQAQHRAKKGSSAT